MSSQTLEMTKNKDAKHSVRYQVNTGSFTLQIYVPRILLVMLGKANPEKVWVTISLEKPQ
jgi:hypothetical protein